MRPAPREQKKTPFDRPLLCGLKSRGPITVGFRESGTCSNGRKVSRSAIEALVFEGLRDELAHPEAIAEYVKTYNEERRRLAGKTATAKNT